MSRVRENRMQGSRWRREETGTPSASPRGTGRLPPTLQRARSAARQDLAIAAMERVDELDLPTLDL